MIVQISTCQKQATSTNIASNLNGATKSSSFSLGALLTGGTLYTMQDDLDGKVSKFL